MSTPTPRKRNPLPLVLGLVLLAGIGGWAWYQQSQHGDSSGFELRRLALLTEENQRLRTEIGRIDPAALPSPLPGQPKAGAVEEENESLRNTIASHQSGIREEEEQAWREKIERQTVAIRGLEFKHPVDYNVLDRADIVKVLEGMVDEHYTAEDFDAIGKAYSLMGLFPEGYDFKKQYLELLGEQIAAFYDQHKHKLFMFRDASLTKAHNRVILSHELTHALQDQHFSIGKLALERKDNDDRVIAAAALVEGDATLEMNAFLLSDASVGDIMGNLAATLAQDLAKLNAAPRILRESLLFPYMEGMKFCTALQAADPEGGFGPINAAFSRVPSSSSQILHPEKYFAGEEPVEVGWSRVEAKGQTPIFQNTLGEFGIGVLLKDWGYEQEGNLIAEGWRGDRYLVFNEGKDLVWRSAWENADEAEEFAVAISKMITLRYEAQSVMNETGGPEDFTTKGGRQIRILRHPQRAEVMLINASDAAWRDALEAQFFVK